MNMIWIIADTLRLKDVGCYGNKTINTPEIDALAAKSVRFNRHYAAGFPTMPARADFLTGRFSQSFMIWEPLPRSQVRLPQLLLAEGIRTAAMVDTPFYIRDGMNYNRGFQTFIEISGQTVEADEVREAHSLWCDESDRYAPRTFIQAMKWLERHYKEDFFLYIDTWDPHEPWDAPEYFTEPYWPGYDGEIINPVYGHWQDEPGFTAEKVRKAHATYCGEITMVDTWLGYFLKKVENMGLMDKTAIVFTTDHGFYFGEHGGLFGKVTHALELKEDAQKHIADINRKAVGWDFSPNYEELTAIPLLIYVPGYQPGTYDGLTWAIDLMPTVLDIMGQEIPSFVEGSSLLPKIKNNSLGGREFVITTHTFENPGDDVATVDGRPHPLVKYADSTVTTDEWTLLYAVEQGLSELYHLPSDRRQEKNVIAKNPDIARSLHKILVNFMRETNVSQRSLEPRLELRI
jgi:arylsulfatase A-like enzyme